MDTQTRTLMEKINRNDKVQSDKITELEKKIEILIKELDAVKKAFIKKAEKEVKKVKES